MGGNYEIAPNSVWCICLVVLNEWWPRTFPEVHLNAILSTYSNVFRLKCGFQCGSTFWVIVTHLAMPSLHVLKLIVLSGKPGNSETYDVQSWRQWVPDLELDDGLKRFSLVWRFFSSFLPEFPFCRERRNSEIFEFPVDVNAASKYKPSDVTSPIRGVQLFFMAMQTNTSWQHSNVSLLWSHMFYVLLKCVSPPSFRRIGSFDEDVSRSSHSDVS